MKKIILLNLIVLIVFSFIGCSNNRDLEISGEFQFEKVVYLSPLSSSTIDYEEKQMEGTIYKINKDNFEIVSLENQYKISDPIYEKKWIMYWYKPLMMQFLILQIFLNIRKNINTLYILVKIKKLIFIFTLWMMSYGLQHMLIIQLTKLIL